MTNIFSRNPSRVEFHGGVPIQVNNRIQKIEPNCYISYNRYEPHYDSDTTAIVVTNYGTIADITNGRNNRHDSFFILKGKHEKLLGMNTVEALEYYHKSDCKLIHWGDSMRTYLLNLSFFDTRYKEVGIY